MLFSLSSPFSHGFARGWIYQNQSSAAAKKLPGELSTKQVISPVLLWLKTIRADHSVRPDLVPKVTNSQEVHHEEIFGRKVVARRFRYLYVFCHNSRWLRQALVMTL